MTMQATRQSQMASGTFEAEKPRDATDRGLPEAIAEAHRLASVIEELLAHRADEADAYGMRLARALAKSLIDQLAELSRDRKPDSRLP